MEEKDLIELIGNLQKLGRESKTIDAKQELTLKDKEVGTKAEFVKDIAAMANNGEKSYIIIGLRDGTFESVGSLRYSYSKNDLNQVLSGKIDPPVIVDYKEFNINGDEYGLIEIIGHNPPYIIACDLVSNKTDKKKIAIYKGTIFVRHEDSTEGISRSELETLLKARGLKKDFESETAYAQQLVFDRPMGWEYLLTGELLKSKLVPIKRKFDEIQRGLIYKKSIPLQEPEFISWVQSKCDDIANLAEITEKVINEEISIAMGPPGVSGEPLEVKHVVEKLISVCSALVEWEIDVRYVSAPEPFQPLKQKMGGWTKQFIDEVARISDEIDKLAEILNQPNPTGKYTINLVFEAPDGLSEFIAEAQNLQRFRNR